MTTKDNKSGTDNDKISMTKKDNMKVVRCENCGIIHPIVKIVKLFEHNICLNCFNEIHRQICIIAPDLLDANRQTANNMSKCYSEEIKKIFSEDIDARDLVKHLDEHIIGQDYAKKILSTAVANHYKRVQRIINPKLAKYDVDIEKSSIIAVGLSGSGKTAIIKALAKKLNIPLAIVDASSLTASGYVGADVATAINRLFLESGGDVQKTEFGIVFLDEFDKLARKTGQNSSVTADPKHEAVQQELLKIIEGGVMGLSSSLLTSKRTHPEAPVID